ncbi:response regulator transcription factor [Lactiplantibacillus paraplantarum]|uniref:response regulator transcription factor n=1 Tax=Lactiplantibacillus paraplantarum TaxID=60520 RepID=UPI000512B07A|nr:response regulator transcription factor [Lactiplantibacillus paraplantarum]OAX75601.1 DNA-binding response regulator [Lactiplantibacillus plantarum]ALO03126.1 PhoB family transcriptional regulator [Lactiplantibacillus paraplantarum]KGE76099.1 PhoB family transcriptional regulator [Lactiplantibacillus paraplantarum]MCW1909101.1 response regulator transcription factor [Lactiplantibacillus paraplantarum]RDG10465.1 DNA-binding response regulator [Lactiplantibacillus paraplantarum]
MKNTILIVEDEDGLSGYLTKELQFEDFNVLVAADGLDAMATYQAHQNELLLILLDWMLPKLDGMEVLRRIRKHDQVPVIIMTARDYVGDKVAGLDNGADDYITKPFEIEELLARIRVIQRRIENQVEPNQVYQLDDVQLDTKAHRVTNADSEITLTHREYDLLQFFLAHPDEVFTRDDLLDQVWGADFLGQQNVVDVYVGYLRNKITSPGAAPLIQTVRGVGYKLREPMSDVQN